MHRTFLRLSVMLAAVTLAHACGDGDDPAQPEPARPTTVTITPATAELTAVGATVQLSARVLDQNGQAMAGANVTWASSDAAVATVSPNGLVAAVATGATTITATAGTASGEAVVTVMQSASSVVVSPSADTVAAGDTLRLVAEAFDENEHRIESVEFTWSSSDSSVATVDGSGLVRGVTEGATSVTASAASAQGTARITVTRPPPKPGPGLDIFDFPMRAVAISGYWGTNRRVAQPWEDGGQRGPLIPLAFIDWLDGMHANWILISVGLHYDDSMDGSVSRETDRGRNVPTWRDGTLRQVIREFRDHGFDVYMTLAFEAHEAETSARPSSAGSSGIPRLHTPAACRQAIRPGASSRRIGRGGPTIRITKRSPPNSGRPIPGRPNTSPPWRKVRESPSCLSGPKRMRCSAHAPIPAT